MNKPGPYPTPKDHRRVIVGRGFFAVAYDFRRVRVFIDTRNRGIGAMRRGLIRVGPVGVVRRSTAHDTADKRQETA